MEKENKTIKRIIETGAQLFRKRGFRAVSMDDLANELGMSKKTIYRYFESKNNLVAILVKIHVEDERQKILDITQSAKDPIHEMVAIGQFLFEHYKEMTQEIIQELKKYYYDIWEGVDRMQNEFMLKGVLKNIQNGIERGLYRSDIKAEFIANLYVNSIINTCENESLSGGIEQYYLMVLRYHMYGIMTPKGRALFEQYQSILGS